MSDKCVAVSPKNVYVLGKYLLEPRAVFTFGTREDACARAVKWQYALVRWVSETEHALSVVGLFSEYVLHPLVSTMDMLR